MSERFKDKLRFWESPEHREARGLEPADFAAFGLPEAALAELFADDSREMLDRRRRIHRIGESFQPIIELGSAVPPEYERLFGEGGPLNAPLPMTGRTIVESAVGFPDEFGYAEEYLMDVGFDLASWLDV